MEMIYTYCGKLITDMTREELIEALTDTARESVKRIEASAERSRQLVKRMRIQPEPNEIGYT